MYKYVIVTDPETAAGFRLAGVEVIEVASPDEAKKAIPPLLNADDTGIIGVSEEFMSVLDPELLATIEKTYRPIIIPIPSRTKKVAAETYIERLLRRAIGYNIVVRR
jgi:V/A-type H+/Na+-transporting ATPase subunit F